VNPYEEAQLDALGDPIRRAILVRLLEGPAAVLDLAKTFPISRPAISQHLRVLKNAHLVEDQAKGNRRLYAIDAGGFALLREYFEKFWNIPSRALLQPKVDDKVSWRNWRLL
jgi:DNA-binding transcriptional ArsR family regulator